MSDNQFSSGRSLAHQLTEEDAARIQAQFFAQVYGWMAAGLALTGGMALFAATVPAVQQFVFGSPFVYLGFILLQVVIVSLIATRIFQWSRGQAQAAFVGYSLLTGVTISFIFMRYTSGSIASTFFTTALTFGVMSVYGYFTKTDLSSWGKMLSMVFIGLFIAMAVNVFWGNSLLNLIASCIGVILFTALAAYNTQKLKDIAFIGVTEGEEMSNKASILGALTLYINFINLFMFLLNFSGRRR
jgi:FtsH-binding integral membrane protein